MKKVVDGFIGYWRVPSEASLPFTTEDGKVTLACYELWAWEPPASEPLAPDAPALCLHFNMFFFYHHFGCIAQRALALTKHMWYFSLISLLSRSSDRKMEGPPWEAWRNTAAKICHRIRLGRRKNGERKTKILNLNSYICSIKENWTVYTKRNYPF